MLVMISLEINLMHVTVPLREFLPNNPTIELKDIRIYWYQQIRTVLFYVNDLPNSIS